MAFLSAPRTRAETNRLVLMPDVDLIQSQIVTAVPEVRQLALQSGDEFLLLACDGIWDVLTNQEVRGRSVFPRRRTVPLACSGAEPSLSFIDFALVTPDVHHEHRRALCSSGATDWQ